MPAFDRLRLVVLSLVFWGFCLPFSVTAQQKKYPESAYPESFRLVLPKRIPYRLGSLWGYADSTGTLKIQPQYTFAEPFENGLALVHKEEQTNLIDERGKEIFKWEFRNMYVWNNRLIFAETTERLKGLYSISGKEILPPEYREVTTLKRTPSTAPNLIVAWKEEKKEPTGSFSANTIYNYSLFTEEGKLLLTGEFQDLSYLGAGIIKGYKDHRFYYFNEQGNALPAFQDYNVEEFKKGFAVISRDRKYGIIDSLGNVVIQPQYEGAKSFSEDRAAVKSNGMWAFADKSGNLLTPFKFTEPGIFMNGYAIVQTGRNGFGLLDKNGKEATALIYSYIYGAKPGQIYAFNMNNVVKYGIITKDSGKVVMPGYSEINYFTEGLAVAVKDGKKGFIDENGKVIIPFEYAEARGFKDGLAAVNNGKNWGVINTQQETVIPFNYASIEVLNPDRFIVGVYNWPAWIMKSLMNAKGQEIAPLKYTDIGQPELDRLVAGINFNWGMIDMNGRELIKPEPLKGGYETNGGLKNGLQQIGNSKTRKVGYRDWKGRLYFKD